MKIKLLAAAAAVAVAAPAFAQQGPTIDVVTWVAPNVYSGSPSVDSYDTWQANAISALKTGTVTPTGTPNTPGYAFEQSTITRADMIVTGGNSWEGSADPGVTYGAAYANEQGTRPYFGVIINGNGTKYSLSQLGLTVTSNDGHADYQGGSNGYFGFAYGAASADPADAFTYANDDVIGIIAGADGLFGPGATYVTSGSADQMVDGFIAVGYGSSDDPCTGTPYDGLCGTTAGRQAAIDDETTNGIFLSSDPTAARLAWPTTYTGTYTLGGASATGTFTINAAAPVPEAATWAMMIAGVGLAGAALRRRRTTVAFG